MNRRPQVRLTPGQVEAAFAEYGTTLASAGALGMTFAALDRRLVRDRALRAAADAGRVAYRVANEPLHGDVRRFRQGCHCTLCRVAQNDYMQAFRAARFARAVPEGTAHGASVYSNYGCRCEVCSTAHSEACKRRYYAQKATVS